jgi:hypothetical protein
VARVRALRWDLKYVMPPYQGWTRETFDEEQAAQRRFVALSEQTPMVVNLSMRSHLEDGPDDGAED